MFCSCVLTILLLPTINKKNGNQYQKRVVVSKMSQICSNICLCIVTALSIWHCACFEELRECVDEFSVNITIDSGTICGLYKHTTILGERKFYSFQGIPYAQPPIDDLRFKVCNI